MTSFTEAESVTVSCPACESGKIVRHRGSSVTVVEGVVDVGGLRE